MKKFAIINGERLILKAFSDDNDTVAEQKAVEWAQNHCDHSKEVIVREFTLAAGTDVMLTHITDMQLTEELRTRNYALSIWEYDDVESWAISQGILLTEDEMNDIVSSMDNCHDADVGINWHVIDAYCDDIVGGRDFKPEDIIAVDCEINYCGTDEWTNVIIQLSHDVNLPNAPYTDDDVFYYAMHAKELMEMFECVDHRVFRVYKINELITATKPTDQ